MSATANAQETVLRQLGLLSKGSLGTVGDHLGLGLLSGEGGTDLEAIAAAVGTPVHLRLLRRFLTSADWALLSLLPLQMGPFQVPTILVALRKRGFGADAGLTVAGKLLACAALLPVRTSRAQAKLNIEPAQIRNWAHSAWLELAPNVAEWAEEQLGRSESLEPAAPPAQIAGSALPEMRRVALLLVSETRRRPIRITTAGAPNKTDLRRVAAAIGIAGGDRGKREVNATSVPDLLYLVLATLVSARLLRFDTEGLRPVPETADLFTAPAERQVALLFQAWARSRFDDFACVLTLSRSYGGDGPWMREDRTYTQPTDTQTIQARFAIANALVRLVRDSPGSWYGMDDLSEFLREQYPELLFAHSEEYGLLYDVERLGRYGETTRRRQYPGIYRRLAGGLSLANPESATLYHDSHWMEVEGAFIRQVLAGSMRYLGMTEVGPDSVTPDRFRLTALGQSVLLGVPLPEEETASEGRAAVVQPNFEVVVLDSAANFSLLAKLDAFAERKSLDRAATYQITQAALVRGLDQGWLGAQILGTLEAGNGGPLPQNVRYSLDQWLGLYESLTLREWTTLFEVDTPEQLDRMLADPRLAPLLGDRLGPTWALIPGEHLEAVVAAGREAGGLKMVDLGSERSGAIRIRQPDRIDLRDVEDEPYLRYRLGAFAEAAEAEDGWHGYQMTAEMVARAVEDGWNGPSLAIFLEQVLGEELPAEFLVRLLGWSRAVPSLAAERLIAVQAGDGGLDWELLRQIPALDSIVRAVLNRSVALIAAEDLETLRAELEARGLTLEEAALPGSALTPVIQESALRAALDRYWEGPQAIRQTLQALGVAGKRRPRRRGRD